MKEKLLMLLFVVILGSILTTALIGVNGFTAPKIDGMYLDPRFAKWCWPNPGQEKAAGF